MLYAEQGTYTALTSLKVERIMPYNLPAFLLQQLTVLECRLPYNAAHHDAFTHALAQCKQLKQLTINCDQVQAAVHAAVHIPALQHLTLFFYCRSDPLRANSELEADKQVNWNAFTHLTPLHLERCQVDKKFLLSLPARITQLKLTRCEVYAEHGSGEQLRSEALLQLKGAIEQARGHDMCMHSSIPHFAWVSAFKRS